MIRQWGLTRQRDSRCSGLRSSWKIGPRTSEGQRSSAPAIHRAEVIEMRMEGRGKRAEGKWVRGEEKREFTMGELRRAGD